MGPILRWDRPIQADITDTGRIRSTSVIKDRMGRIPNNSETARLVRVEIAAPANADIYDMLDFCIDNPAQLATFSESYDDDGNHVVVFHFYNSEFALAFKLKFL